MSTFFKVTVGSLLASVAFAAPVADVNWGGHTWHWPGAAQTTTDAVVASSTTTPAAVVAPAPTSTTPVVVAPTSTSTTAIVVAPAPTSTTPVIVIAPAPTSTTPVAVPVASTPAAVAPAAAATGKRGVAYSNVLYSIPFEGHSAVTWAYNWDSSVAGLSTSSFNYAPMLWGTGAVHTSIWEANVVTAIATGATHILAFNEPDVAAQANLSPSDAAAAYMQYIQPYAGQVKLGAPSVTNGGAPMGLTWLGNFMSACSSCTIDFVVIHWYDSATNIAYFKSHIQDAYAQSGKNIWLNEFGATGTDAEVETFFQTVLPWLDSLAYVERYSYFMAAPGILLNAAGTGLSAIGQSYAST